MPGAPEDNEGDINLATTDQRIDIHSHFLPDFYIRAAKEAGLGPTISRGFPEWTPELALEMMDRHGIATSVTSISQPGLHFGNDEKARDLARKCNEYAAGLVAQWPTRFGAFASLPLPDVAGSCREVEHALDVMGLDGVCLLASYGEKFLGDPLFDPVLDALNQRDAVVFVHPNFHPSSRALDLKIPAFMVEFTFDTTRAAVNMLISGTLDRFPRIKFILAHAGGTLPYLAWRLSVAPLVDQRVAHLSAEHILAKLRGFWYDTAQAAGPQTMGVLNEVADPERILFGSDWPYCPETVVAETAKALREQDFPTPGQHEGINHGNALKLFSRLSSLKA
jgi:predicted TIM-barrel fold metal-dependent hydrolase